MPSMYVRDVPAALYRKIKEQAEADKRSMQKEVVWLLERAMAGEKPHPDWQRVRSFRESMRSYGVLSDSAPMIREMRDGR